MNALAKLKAYRIHWRQMFVYKRCSILMHDCHLCRLQGLTEDVASTKSAVLAAIGPPIKMTGAAMPWNWQSQAFWALTGAAVGVMGCYAALSLRSRQLT